MLHMIEFEWQLIMTMAINQNYGFFKNTMIQDNQEGFDDSVDHDDDDKHLIVDHGENVCNVLLVPFLLQLLMKKKRFLNVVFF